jgi:hypothetical protein
MKGNTKLRILLVLLVLLVVVTVVISKSNLSRETPLPSAPATHVVWKTYTSGQKLKENGIAYTIQYPADWVVSQKNPDRIAAVPWITLRSHVLSEKQDTACVAISGKPKTTASTFEIFMQEENDRLNLQADKFRVNKTENIILSGIAGIRRNGVTSANQTLQQVFLEDKSAYFSFVSCPGTAQTVFDRIVATFQANN